MLCNHYLYLVSEHFHQPKRKSHICYSLAPHSPLLSVPSNHKSAFCLCIIYIFKMRNSVLERKALLVQILTARNNGVGILSPSLKQPSYKAFATQLL